MANIKSARKRIIQSKKKNQQNSEKRSIIRTSIKKVNFFIFSKKDKEQAKMEFKNMQSILDNYSRKGIIHKNKASRHKKKLFFKIKSM